MTGVIALGTLEIRPMRAGDVAAVRRLAARIRPTVVQRYAQRWQKGQFSGSVVAMLDGRLACFSQTTFTAPEEAWLEGMMVDDRVREHGISSAVTADQVEYAREHGASVVRLSTAADNGAVQHICIDKLGFFEHSRWLRVHSVPDKVITGWAPIDQKSVSSATVWQFMVAQADGPVLWTMPSDFTIQAEAHAGEVKTLIDRRLALMRLRDGRLDGLALLAPLNQENAPENTVRVIYLAARSDRGLQALLASARELAKRRGRKLALMIPVTSATLRQDLSERLTAAKVEWTELVLLAKDLS